MFPWACKILAASALVASLACQKTSGPVGAPQVHFPELRKDLGDVAVDPTEPYGVSFRFKNRGLAALEIGRVVASCSCADVTINKKLLEPGEEGQLHVHVLAQVPEERRASVTLNTNDPTQPQVKVEVSWRAVAPLEFDRYRIDFGTLRPGESAEQTLELARNEDERWTSCRITGISCTPPANLKAAWIQEEASLSSDAEPRAGSKLHVQLVADNESGERTGKVNLELNECWQPILSVPISWRVRDVIEASPSSLFLSIQRPGQLRVGQVVVSTDPGEELIVQRAELIEHAEKGEVTWEHLGSARVLVKLSLQIPDEAGLHKSKLRIVCTQPAERTLVVPVLAYSADSDSGGKR